MSVCLCACCPRPRFARPSDFEDDESKERFARKMMNVWRFTSGCFFLSLFCLMWSLVFMGWGCGFPDKAFIPAIVGSLGLFALVAGMAMGDRAYVFATSMPETERDEDTGYEAAYTPLLASANAVAFPSTVSAGFGTPPTRRLRVHVCAFCVVCLQCFTTL